MKTWAVRVHVNIHVNSHANVHVSMPHQQPCHLHDLIYDECHLTFCDVYLCHRNWARVGLGGSNLIYDGVEMEQIASIYDILCKNIIELICDG
jgi:hypothetical protein